VHLQKHLERGSSRLITLSVKTEAPHKTFTDFWTHARTLQPHCNRQFLEVTNSIVSITYHTTGVRKGCTGAYCGLEFVPRK